MAIVNAVNHYQSAWNQFRKVPGTSTPTFQTKGYAQSYQTNGMYPKTACAINDGNIHLTDKRHIKLPKLGSVRFKGSDRIYKIFARTCETRIGTITISKDECGHYYASLQIASIYPFHKQIRHSGKALGIDVNIENFCMDSNGDTVPNPKFRKATQEKLCKEQRQLSRMATRAKKEHRSLRDSRNYQKQRIKVAKLHKHAAAQNEAFQHLLSKAIIESQDIVCVEKLTLSDREWNCPKCGRHHIRDWNSAINIRNRGLAILQTP